MRIYVRTALGRLDENEVQSIRVEGRLIRADIDAMQHGFRLQVGSLVPFLVLYVPAAAGSHPPGPPGVRLPATWNRSRRRGVGEAARPHCTPHAPSKGRIHEDRNHRSG